MTSPIIYTLATEADIHTLADCRIHFLTSLFGSEKPETTERLKHELVSYFQRAMTEQRVICWLAKKADTIVGIGTLALREQPGNFKNPSGKVGYIQNMYTDPAYRRQGISSTILDYLVKTARNMGITAFELHATKEGEPVYVHYGFIEHPEPTYRLYIP